MIHHDCRHAENDYDGILGEFSDKPAMAVTDRTGQYRCTECKRKVRLADGSRRGPIGDGGGIVEPPYPPGWCE